MSYTPRRVGQAHLSQTPPIQVRPHARHSSGRDASELPRRRSRSTAPSPQPRTWFRAWRRRANTPRRPSQPWQAQGLEQAAPQHESKLSPRPAPAFYRKRRAMLALMRQRSHSSRVTQRSAKEFRATFAAAKARSNFRHASCQFRIPAAAIAPETSAYGSAKSTRLPATSSSKTSTTSAASGYRAESASQYASYFGTLFGREGRLPSRRAQPPPPRSWRPGDRT